MASLLMAGEFKCLKLEVRKKSHEDTSVSKAFPLAEFGLGPSGWLVVSKARIKVILSNLAPKSAVLTHQV